MLKSYASIEEHTCELSNPLHSMRQAVELRKSNIFIPLYASIRYEGKVLTEMIAVPRPLLEELYEHFDRIEEILATLEELSNKKGLKRIDRARQEYVKKECLVVNSPDKIREALTKD